MSYQTVPQPQFPQQPPQVPATYGAPPPNYPPGPAPADIQMTKLVEYARQTRTATVFIAWVIGIGVTIMLIVGIIVGIQTAKVANELNTGGIGTSSNCQSQGGTNPSC